MPKYLQTHAHTTQQKLVKNVLVGFLLDDHGCSCDVHPFGCGNALLESEGNGVGRLVRLCLVEQIHIAGYAVREDSTDDCRVWFAAQEYTNGDIALHLDGCLLRITEVFLPDSENCSMHALYHRNWVTHTMKQWTSCD
jgi:hypothetical protein